ncbi:MAG: pyridoxal phosphate-dependent aminotransferase [Thermodesulfobacteriota bacterium]
MGQTIAINPNIARINMGERDKLNAAMAGKSDLANLASGNPNFEVPPFILERLRDHLETSTHMPYTNYYGVLELRERIADHLKRQCGMTVDPASELMVTHGVQQGLFVVLKTILRTGDEVLLPSPYYGHYAIDTIACGGRPVPIRLDETMGFMPDLRQFEKAITPKTRAILFCNPNNPLGVVWPGETLEQLAHLARKHDLLVLVDEVYRDFIRPEPPVSLASLPGMAARTFTFNGFSKAYVMMGLRMGYVAAPAKVMPHLKQLQKCVTLYPSMLGEIAALAALDCPREQLDPIHDEIKNLGELLYQAVSSLPGISCVHPPGGFYVFPNVTSLGKSSVDLSIRLIQEAGVACLPGVEFGPDGEGHLRMSVCAGREQVEEGVRRLTQFVTDNH